MNYVKGSNIHTCYCGATYICEYCLTPNGFICPTVNEDEEANMCPSCLQKMVEAMEAAND